LAAREFRDPEIIAVDSAFVVDQGSHSCHDTPRKPDQPRYWDWWGRCST